MNKIRACIHKSRKKIAIWGLIFAICATSLINGSITAKAEESVIKVGYDTNSNFIKKSNGEIYGYGVEYLNKIAEYTDWTYEYVNDASWQDSMDKLRNGEIDLICTAHYTEERAQEFLYSDIPLGYETTLLYTDTESDITYQDYKAMNGCKAGLLTDSYSATEFLEYIKEHEITCEIRYFQREDDMLTALHSGEIDMLAIGSRYATSDLKMLDRLGANAFYCITNKDNPELIEEIEEVLQQIMFDDPQFEGELNKEYFGHNSISHTPLYTKEEMAFIESQDVIKVKIMMNQKPSAYVENGEVKGIWAEYIKLLSHKSGIQFELELGSLTDNYTEETYDQLLQQDYLLFRTQRAREHNNRIGENIASIPLADISISYIIRQEEFEAEQGDDYKVAITKDLSYVEPLLLQENSEYEILYYDTGESCLEALLHKEVDMVVQSSYWASYLMQKPVYADKLTEIPGTDYFNKIVLVADDDQQILIDILNKAINHISQEERDEIVTRELLLNPYPIEIDDIWYQHWEWIILVGIVLIIVLITYTIMTQRTAALKLQQKENEILEKKLQLDELTGLYNRTYFFEKARDVIDHAQEEMCIVMMNIQNFKIINEMYGMVTGDRILKEIGEQVLQVANARSLIAARFMADYYFICVPKAVFEEMNLPTRIKTSLEEMDIKVVYGVFLVEDQKALPVNIMCDRANIAAHDRNYTYTEYIHFYNDAQRQQRMIEQEIENDMEQAIENREFAAYIQPKYDVASGKIVGGEALVRWFHPVKGMVSPGIFISVFEKNGFIIQLDYYVWEETCRMLAEFKKAGLKSVPISINVSKAHFYGKDLRNKLNDLVLKYGLDPIDLELEITESICAENPDEIIGKIYKLQQDGFRIAMDDFGSGYSSLNMLKEMPLDIIKMDLKFLDGGEESELKSRYILKSLIDLAQAMDLKVVVEGVETESQVEFLRQFYGCYAQGYYFSRPIDCAAYRELLINE